MSEIWNTGHVAMNDKVPVQITGVPSLGRVLLASGSPRRLELLRSAGVEPVVAPTDVDETPRRGESPESYVARLAEAKAAACRATDHDVVIAADTTVDLDGVIIGKPADADETAAILSTLSGRDHLVHTGVAVRYQGHCDVRVVSTRVCFADLDQQTIDWYVSTGESVDKAGAYALQGSGACLVAEVHGSVSNVIGLPLSETLAMLGVQQPVAR